MNPYDIVREEAERLGVSLRDILGPGKSRSMVLARKLAAKRLDEMGLSSREIGQKLGGRSHSTVLNLLGRLRRNVDKRLTKKSRRERTILERMIEDEDKKRIEKPVPVLPGQTRLV